MKNIVENQGIKIDNSDFTFLTNQKSWLKIPADGSPLTFTGNADEAAKEFFNALIRVRDGYISALKAERDALAVENAALKSNLMFWDADDPESPYDCPEEIANECELNYNDEFEVQVAARLPNRKYRVCESWEYECKLELVEGDEIETPATDAALAAIEVRGVEKAIELLLNKFSGTGHIGVPVMALESLAAELREAK